MLKIGAHIKYGGLTGQVKSEPIPYENETVYLVHIFRDGRNIYLAETEMTAL